MVSENTIRIVLQKHLAGGEAFMPLTDMFSKITFEKVGERPYNVPYSFYKLFYHITYAQKDILKFCVSEVYTTPNWPDDYWTKQQAPKNESIGNKYKKTI